METYYYGHQWILIGPWCRCRDSCITYFCTDLDFQSPASYATIGLSYRDAENASLHKRVCSILWNITERGRRTLRTLNCRLCRWHWHAANVLYDSRRRSTMLWRAGVFGVVRLSLSTRPSRVVSGSAMALRVYDDQRVKQCRNEIFSYISVCYSPTRATVCAATNVVVSQRSSRYELWQYLRRSTCRANLS